MYNWAPQGDLPPVAASQGARGRSHMSSAVMVVLTMLVIVFCGLALVPMTGAVIASGRVEVESRVKRISHPSGGIVSEILVANGDHVVKDQPLVRFDAAIASTEDAMTTMSVEQLLAQRARLDAERLGADSVAFPPELAGTPGGRQAMLEEGQLFATRRSQLDQQRRQLMLRVDQYNEQIGGITAQLAGYQKQRHLITPELAGVRDLWNSGLVTISRLNQLERTAADLEASMGSARSQIAQIRSKISETQEQILSLDQSRRAEAGQQYGATSTTLNDQKMRKVSAREANRHSTIRAPNAGYVNRLVLTAIGDVVKPGEAILEIVPDEDRLTVTLALSPNDIDQVRLGQSATIRFTAFNSTATPEIDGKVSYVAAERTTDPEGKTSYYEARVTVDREEMAAHRDMVLKPGMPAEVFIRTGSRSMLSYITKPLRDQFARSFRDN